MYDEIGLDAINVGTLVLSDDLENVSFLQILSVDFIKHKVWFYRLNFRGNEIFIFK